MHHFKEIKMNKLQMAHEMALAIQGTKLIHDMELVSDMAWKYADAMQAEAEKREKEKQDKAKQEQQNYEDALDSISAEEEWQPDWSQSPDWANWWAIDKDLVSFWHEDKPKFDEIEFYQCGMFCDAPRFNYQGNWQDSLRKRP